METEAMKRERRIAGWAEFFRAHAPTRVGSYRNRTPVVPAYPKRLFAAGYIPPRKGRA